MRVVALVCLLSGMASLSGCVGDDALEPFDTVPVPVWEPGHTWTWDVSVDSSERAGETQERGTLEQTVLAADEVDGRAVYWTRTEQDVSPLSLQIFGSMSSPYQVIGQADLLSIGQLHWFGYGEEGCTERVYQLDQYPPLPTYVFPLVSGGTWTKTAEDAVYHGKVAGAGEVRTPAGTFDAVKIRVDIEPREELVKEHDLWIEAWYAEEVEHFVRVETRYFLERDYGGDSGVYRQDHHSLLELSGYSLTSGKAEHPPLYQIIEHGTPAGVAPKQYGIVSDAAFPLNAAGNATTVTFGIETVDVERDDVRQEASLVPFEDLQRGQVVLWRMTDSEYDLVASGTGPTWTVEIPGTGRFDIEAYRTYERVEDAAPECFQRDRFSGLSGYDDALERASFTVGWGLPFEIDHAAGPGAVYALGTVPVTAWAAFEADYTVEDSVVGGGGGHLRLTSPSGKEVDVVTGERAFAGRDEAGTWEVAWVAKTDGTFGPLDLTLGHRVDGLLRITY